MNLCLYIYYFIAGENKYIVNKQLKLKWTGKHTNTNIESAQFTLPFHNIDFS